MLKEAVKIISIFKYAQCLVDFTARDRKKIGAVSDELQQRRLFKRHYVHQLVIAKMTARALERDYAQGTIEMEQYRHLRRIIGVFVLGSLKDMEQNRIRLNEGECREIFNIPAQVWKASHSRKKQNTTLDIDFIYKVSDEVMIDFMADALIMKLEDASKVNQQLENHMSYEHALPSNGVVH